MRMVALARLYFLGSVRRKIHVTTALVSLVMLGLPTYVNEFSLGTNAFERVSKDFGLSLIGLFAVGMAILLGSTSLPADLEHRSVYPILARPVHRASYLAAHLLALAALLAVSLLCLGSALTLSLALKSGKLDPSVMLGVFGCFLQAVVVGSVCLTFSTLCSPALAGTIGVAAYVVGNMSGAFIKFFLVEDRESVLSAGLARALKSATPNLAVFDIKDPMVHGLDLPNGYLLSLTYYALAWVLFLLALSRVGFQGRDL